MMEEWIARRIDSAHVLKPHLQSRKRGYFYVVTEFVDGQTLGQWMIDNPRPDLETVRGIVEQVARGLRAFHRLEMLHRDLRPENIMIDRTGTARIIDFGSTLVAGVAETEPGRRSRPRSGHGAIHRTRVFPGRRRHALLRPVLAGRDRLPDADGKAALRRGDGEGAHEIAATPHGIPLRTRRRSRDPGLDRRRAQEGRPSRSAQALRGIVRVRVRPSPSRRALPAGRRPRR